MFGIHGHWRENKILLAADPDYVKNLASDTNINRRKAWLNGDWDIVAGGFFDDVWDRAKHRSAIPYPRELAHRSIVRLGLEPAIQRRLVG